MTEDVASTVVVVGARSFEVAVYRRTPRSMLVAVVSDGRDQWSFDVAGWRPWSCGVSAGQFYLWSARQLIVFPTTSAGDPAQVEFDEDLLRAFKVDAGWVFVCETSVRLSAERGEIARIELDEVVESAWWKYGRVIVRDVSGEERSIAVSEGALVVAVDE